MLCGALGCRSTAATGSLNGSDLLSAIPTRMLAAQLFVLPLTTFRRKIDFLGLAGFPGSENPPKWGFPVFHSGGEARFGISLRLRASGSLILPGRAPC